MLSSWFLLVLRSGKLMRMYVHARAHTHTHARTHARTYAGEPCFYIMDLGAGLYVDARHRGNLARLLNSRYRQHVGLSSAVALLNGLSNDVALLYAGVKLGWVPSAWARPAWL
eukprot:1141157-Pelagomonas_calceolata.AAC.6